MSSGKHISKGDRLNWTPVELVKPSGNPVPVKGKHLTKEDLRSRRRAESKNGRFIVP